MSILSLHRKPRKEVQSGIILKEMFFQMKHFAALVLQHCPLLQVGIIKAHPCYHFYPELIMITETGITSQQVSVAMAVQNWELTKDGLTSGLFQVHGE